MIRILVPAVVLLALMMAGCGKDDAKSFGRTDLNKDGKVIFEEGVIAYPDLTIEEFRFYDKDGGGALSGEEYEAFMASRASGTPQKAAVEKPAEPAAKPEPVAEPPAAPPAAPTAAPTAAMPPESPPAAPPAAPAPDAASPPATVTVQSVETPSTAASVSAAAPEKKPAGPSEVAYTVQRGDSLNKIARKFKVDVKAIMVRNKIDNPDKVAAGQVLDIPLHNAAAASDAAPATALTAFVETFFKRSGAAEPDELLTLYAEEVDFYKKGVVKKDFVREDKVRYFERWPKRTYTPSATPTVTPVPGTDRVRIDAPVRYQVKSGDKSASGEALFVFEVVTRDGAPRIVFEDSTVTAKP